MTVRAKRTLLVGMIVATLGCATILLLAALAGGSAGGTLASGRGMHPFFWSM